jgi:hypothetical protein
MLGSGVVQEGAVRPLHEQPVFDTIKGSDLVQEEGAGCREWILASDVDVHIIVIMCKSTSLASIHTRQPA